MEPFRDLELLATSDFESVQELESVDSVPIENQCCSFPGTVIFKSTRNFEPTP
jgi:hypothetical protein